MPNFPTLIILKDRNGKVTCSFERRQVLKKLSTALEETKESNINLNLLIDNYQESYSFQIACTYGFFQDKDKTFYWLDKAIFYKDFGLMESHIDPALEECRKNKRWPAFVARLEFLGEVE